jgi:glycerophosphoryl diester phosphodiesterase
MLELPYQPVIVAHRGGTLWTDRPENSAQAFEAAFDDGFFSECDVWPSADGVPVVMHDPALDRMTTAFGRIDARTAAELRAIPLRSIASPAPTIPLLAEVAKFISLVEIKPRDDARLVEAVFDIMAGKIQQRGAAAGQACTLISFDETNLRHARRLDSATNVALLVDDPERIEIALDEKWPVYLNHAILDDRVAGRLHDAGLPIGAWTVNEQAALERILPYRPDVIISDAPRLMRTWLQQAGLAV